MNVDEDELTDRFLEEFSCTRSEAERVSSKVADYVRDKEASGLTDKMKDPNYIPTILQKKAPEGSIASQWNWWIGQFSNDGSYQVK